MPRRKKSEEAKPVEKKSRKKRAAKKKTNGEPKKRKRRAALSEVGTHRLRRDQLMKWRTLEAELRAAQMQIQMADMTLKSIIQQTPQVSKAMHNLEVAKRMFREKHAEYLGYMGTLGESLGLDLSKCAIDDQSGLVREMEAKASE